MPMTDEEFRFALLDALGQIRDTLATTNERLKDVAWTGATVGG